MCFFLICILGKNKNSNQRKEASKQQQPPPPTQQQQPIVTPAQQQQKSQQQQQPQQQQQQQQQTPPPVPQTQPAKPNNKTNKMRDLNMKGASKEGTDMDAFHDISSSNVLLTNNNDNVNANVPNTNENNNTNNNIIISDVNNKKTESNETQTIKQQQQQQQQPDIKPVTKGKCVTDIVKDVPKPLTNFYPLQDSNQDNNTNSNQMLTPATDKKVLAKNEFNSSKTVENNNEKNVTDNKPSLPYKEGKKPYFTIFFLG